MIGENKLLDNNSYIFIQYAKDMGEIYFSQKKYQEALSAYKEANSLIISYKGYKTYRFSKEIAII